MLHFFYGLPRIVFLTAPLSYMFFEAHIIQASAALIAVYAIPHLFHANIANSRMQGKYRHTFWAEIYETALAWYILVPTTIALINPKLGKFNVTAKGGMVDEEYFDWKIAIPYLIILGLNIVGLAVGFGRLFWWNAFEFGTVLLNLIWTGYNLVILAATLAVALEARQIRRHWRVRLVLPAMIRLPNGRTVTCETEDFSEGGLAFNLPRNVDVAQNEIVGVTLFRGDREFSFPGTVVFNEGMAMRVNLEGLSLDKYRALVEATFSRADAWQKWLPERDIDRPLHGLIEVFGISLVGMRRFRKSLNEVIPWKHLTVWKK
jgi:cellulose synthase (UDP-forming)